MLKNKYVRLAAMFLGSFALINVGMFFFLKTTQPKMGARVETAAKTEVKAKADSTSHDTTEHHDLAAKVDTAKIVNAQTPDSTLAHSAPDSTTLTPPVAASLVEPPTPSVPPPPEPESSVSSVDSTPVASAADSAVDSSKVAVASPSGDTKEMAKLAKLLESVKPDEAASIAAKLDIEQIVALVMKMKDRSAGRMLAAMPPEQSAKVALRMSQMATQSRSKS